MAFKKYFLKVKSYVPMLIFLSCIALFFWHEWNWLVSFQMPHRNIYLNYLFLRIELYFQCASDCKQTWRKLKSKDPRSQKYLQVRNNIIPPRTTTLLYWGIHPVKWMRYFSRFQVVECISVCLIISSKYKFALSYLYL